VFVGTDVACLNGEFRATNNRVNVYVAPVKRIDEVRGSHDVAPMWRRALQFSPA